MVSPSANRTLAEFARRQNSQPPRPQLNADDFASHKRVNQYDEFGSFARKVRLLPPHHRKSGRPGASRHRLRVRDDHVEDRFSILRH